MKWRLSAVIAMILGMTAAAAPKTETKYGPWIQNVDENGFTVMWTSSEKMLAWVEVAPDDGSAFEACERQRFHQTVAGRRIAGTEHEVRVEGLEPGKRYRYRIYGKVVKDDRDAYATDYGPLRKVRFKGNGTVRTFDRNAGTCRFVMINDIHGKDADFIALTKDVQPDSIDFLLMNGDMVSFITDADTMLRHVFGTVPALVADAPVIWTRGNHETRGREAHLFPRYSKTPTGEPYFMFRHGPAAFLVLDAGEDKPDSNAEYSGTADYDSYRKRELEWLKNAVTSPEFTDAPIKVAIMHIPAFLLPGSWYSQRWVHENFVPVLNDAGVQIMLSGHHHRHIYVEAGECGNMFPILANDDTDRLYFEADADGFRIKTFDLEGRQTSSVSR